MDSTTRIKVLNAVTAWANIRMKFETRYGGENASASRKTRDGYADDIREAVKDLPIEILFGMCMDSFGLYLEREEDIQKVSHVHDIFGKQIAQKAIKDVFGPNATFIVVE